MTFFWLHRARLYLAAPVVFVCWECTKFAGVEKCGGAKRFTLKVLKGDLVCGSDNLSTDIGTLDLDPLSHRNFGG